MKGLHTKGHGKMLHHESASLLPVEGLLQILLWHDQFEKVSLIYPVSLISPMPLISPMSLTSPLSLISPPHVPTFPHILNLSHVPNFPVCVTSPCP